MQTLVAKYIDSFFFNFDRQWRFGPLDALIYSSDLFFLHFVPSHSAWRTVDVLQLLLTLNMYQMAASQVYIPLCRVDEDIQADRTLWLRIICNAFVIFVLIWNAVPASKAVSYCLSCSPSAHLTVFLHKACLTQWKMSFTLSGLFS